ncbi:MAG: ABC transporter ATP-binding protein [Bacteroidota bacterium]|jgi:lipopolysaccharide transport system ATP-binding protein
MKPILEINALSKKFRIQHELQPYLTIRERLNNLVRFRSTEQSEDFWALRDINFKVEAGESIGIIGKNGAGKSTLLKVLSRITPPTKGSIITRGRIASLLEVGTGFHPELTGRENIFLNGSILGMKFNEIRSKFDQIVDFSGVSKFLDTPLKHYSSGMQLRLAFAVAAFLEPEILIIDEVLAVGDAEFQRKCMGKMDEVSQSGRTILFVSHNMGAVKSLCQKAILLNKGTIQTIGPSAKVVEEYLANAYTTTEKHREDLQSSDGRVKLRFPYWIDKNGVPVSAFAYGENPVLRFDLEFKQPVSGLVVGFALSTKDGTRVFTSHSNDDPGFKFPETVSGSVSVVTSLNLPSLSPGVYDVTFGLKDKDHQTLLYIENELMLDINYIRKEKDGDEGLLWHTTKWSLQS